MASLESFGVLRVIGVLYDSQITEQKTSYICDYADRVSIYLFNFLML